MVGAEGEHVFAEDIDLAEHLSRKLFEVGDVVFNSAYLFFDFEDFGEGALPDWLGFEGAAFSLLFEGLKAGVD